jgi:hypothetical protein
MSFMGKIASTMNDTKRLKDHNSMALFLDALAILVGCRDSIGGVLPDGKRPDVLRIDLDREILFMGDAKNTESTGNKETLVRLLSYLRWLASHIAKSDRIGIFAICFVERADSTKWENAVLMLAREIDLMCTEFGTNTFGLGLNVAWFIFRANVDNIMMKPKASDH